MVSTINSLEKSIFQPQVYQRQFSPQEESSEPKGLFTDEDEAIISSQAKLYNELEKFNSGDDNFVQLAEANVMAKITTQAEVNVINAKKDMMDAILNVGK